MRIFNEIKIIGKVRNKIIMEFFIDIKDEFNDLYHLDYTFCHRPMVSQYKIFSF